MKKIKLKNLFTIIKGALIGVVVNLVAVLIFALVLKFVNLPLNIISYVNNAIKVLSIFVMILFVKKSSSGNLFVSGLLSGVLFEVLSFAIFSILNRGVSFDATTVYDLIFAVVVAVVASVVINVLKRKNV